MKSRAGPNAEQERRPGAAAFLDRFGADLDPVIDQKGFQTGVDEGGQRGREGPHRFGRAAGRRTALARRLGLAAGRRTLLARRRVGDRRREAARDGLAPAVDRLDVALPDLLLKQGIGHGDRRFWARHEEPHQQVVREQDEHEPEPGPARRHLRLPGTLRGSRPTVGRLDPPGRCGVAVASCLLSRRVHGHLLGRALAE